MKKSEVLSQLIKQKEPSISELMDENRSLRTKKRAAYMGLIALTAFSLLTGKYAYQTRVQLNKANRSNEALKVFVSHFQEDATKLSEQNYALKEYANDAETFAKSITFYPDMPDSLTDLPDNALESAAEESEKMNTMSREKHEQTLKFLGVDTNLLYRVQNGPCLGE